MFCSLGGVSDARNCEASKKAGDYDVGIVIDRNPPVAIGDNNLEIEIKDKDGKQEKRLLPRLLSTLSSATMDSFSLLEPGFPRWLPWLLL